MQDRILECFDLVQIVFRTGFEGLCANLVFLLLALAILVIIIRKPRNGDTLGFGLVYAQFYSCMFWMTIGIIMSTVFMSTPYGDESYLKTLRSVWVTGQSGMNIVCICHIALMSALVIGLMLRYKSKLIVNVWNVIGISASVISVGLNIVMRTLY